LILILAVVLFHVSSLSAQEKTNETEDDSMKVLRSAQEAISRAIERNQRSVVSVARWKILQRIIAIAPYDRLQALNPSLPRVSSTPKDPDFIPNEFAAGVVVDSKGLILTNYHILAEDSQYVVWSRKKAYEAKVIAADPRSDLAVLQIVDTVSPGDFKPIKFGKADTLRKGHFVIALGNPYSIAREGELCASFGIVSNLRRKAPPISGETHPRLRKPTLHHYGTLIQTDAKLNLCGSGGALVNLHGEMIGLITSIAAQTGYEQSAAYAIPVDETFRKTVNLLKKGEEVEYGLLGVVPQDVSKKDMLDGLRGARIQSVERGTPAWRSELRPGDVIKAVDGYSIRDAEELMLRIGRLPVEARVRLEVFREGRTIQKQVILAKYPVLGKRIFTRRPSWRGLYVDYSTVRRSGPFAYRFSPDLYKGCVWVSEVDKDSPAWHGGLRPGMFITHVEEHHVKTPKEFREAVSDKRRKVKIHLGGLRPGEDSIRAIGTKSG